MVALFWYGLAWSDMCWHGWCGLAYAKIHSWWIMEKPVFKVISVSLWVVSIGHCLDRRGEHAKSNDGRSWITKKFVRYGLFLYSTLQAIERVTSPVPWHFVLISNSSSNHLSPAPSLNNLDLFRLSEFSHHPLSSLPFFSKTPIH